MDLTKRYTDCFALDKKVNILHMVKHHPEWAANRIQVGERALAMLSPEQKRAAEQGEAQNNSGGVAGEQGTANNARDEIAAAEKLCKIYFDIAASCIGEEAVRQRVAAATSPVA